MIIAFIGNDGSGKTTIAKKFEKHLNELGFDVHYKTEFNYFLLSFLLRILGKEKLSGQRRLFLTTNSRVGKPSYFKVWPYLVWLDLWLELLWNKFFNRSRIIIFDRYAFDFLMSWEWLAYADAYLRWLYAHFPKPEIAFLIDVLPSTAYLRKKKTHVYPLRYYEIQRKRYLNLAGALEIRKINAEKAVNECLTEVIVEFRRHFINKLSDEDKVLLFYSWPGFNPFLLQKFNLVSDWDGLNWSYIVEMAVKCGVENVLCKNILDRHKDVISRQICDLLNSVLKKSNERSEFLVRTLWAISRKLSEKNITFVVMKTIAPYEYGATDVDILVRKEDFEKAQITLSSIFEISKTSRGHKAITYRGTLLPVDLHFEISWQGHKVVDAETVFIRKRKIHYKGIELFVPSPEDELLILSAHSIFQHHYTTLGEFFQIIELMSRNQIDRDYILDSSTRFGWGNLLKSLLCYISHRHKVLYSYASFQNICSKKKLLDLNIDAVYFHGFDLIPKEFTNVLDLLIISYRRLRFKITKKLAYNENWLNEKTAY